MELRYTISSHRKDIDDCAIGKPEMLKDFTKERNGVEKGGLVLSQDCFFACIRPEYECLQSLIRRGLRLKSVWMQRRMMSLNLTPPT